MLTSPFSSHGDRRVADRVFGSALTAPRRARAFVRCQLGRWELANLADTTELLVSELVTNAVHATNEVRNAPMASSMFPVALRMVALRLRVSSGSCSLFIEVWDGSESAPMVAESDLSAEGGRGLALVGMLSTNWGHYTARDRGKIVWCELPLPPAALTRPAARPARVTAALGHGKGPAAAQGDAHRTLPRRVRRHPPAERAAGPDEMTMLRVLDGLRNLDVADADLSDG
ncbi:ATP-binding protein [Planotetraspora kaengkrachanensis]|uniref:Histidine kinase/HSP90-like ATPase domain-containing protein n=1 Tax=Planotetraspora kaengkrachanensis TaxID=575193 RepID=A0A8J3PYM3_9ACTN|nr:ATP-binding protein [Planotetraspora kaengkrachanensis]GIG83536.1 hypothetical protein Pka01_66630 [Planotetraspora kaengkrachanensis]